MYARGLKKIPPSTKGHRQRKVRVLAHLGRRGRRPSVCGSGRHRGERVPETMISKCHQSRRHCRHRLLSAAQGFICAGKLVIKCDKLVPADPAVKFEDVSAALRKEVFDRKLAKEEAWVRRGIKARRTRNEGRVRALEALRLERGARREEVAPVTMQLSEADRSGDASARGRARVMKKVEPTPGTLSIASSIACVLCEARLNRARISAGVAGITSSMRRVRVSPLRSVTVTSAPCCAG